MESDAPIGLMLGGRSISWDSARHPSAGFTLLAALFWVLLAGTLILVLQMRVASQSATTGAVERQLYSFIQAANGAEFARTILPGLEIDSLLTGMDGTFASPIHPEWRSPMPYYDALFVEPEDWTPHNDDGLPFSEGGLLLPRGYASEQRGYFFIRFSNNPEEPPDQDRDRVVLVRSLGIAADTVMDPFVPGASNSVTLVETRLRQEVTFDLPSPLVLFGDSGVFDWRGSDFLIDGGENPAVTFVALSPSGLTDAFLSSLSADQSLRVVGAGSPPSHQDATEEYHQTPSYAPLFKPGFWSHLENKLPKYTSSVDPDILYFPEGGLLEGTHTGLVIARGDLTLSDQARVLGLLLHLGGGRLEMLGSARILGGVWLSNLDSSGENLLGSPLLLSVADQSQLVFDQHYIRGALAKLPATQLGWRILFPEMTQ